MSMVHVCYSHHLLDILPIIHALQMQLHNHIDFDKSTGNLVVEACNTCRDFNRLRNFPDLFTNMLMVYSGTGFGCHGLCQFLYEIEPASSWYQQYYNCEQPHSAGRRLETQIKGVNTRQLLNSKNHRLSCKEIVSHGIAIGMFNI